MGIVQNIGAFGIVLLLLFLLMMIASLTTGDNAIFISSKPWSCISSIIDVTPVTLHDIGST